MVHMFASGVKFNKDYNLSNNTTVFVLDTKMCSCKNL